MAGNHSVASKVNKDVLVNDLGLQQFSNTTIFRKEGYFVLSPSMQSASLWFDLRKVNIDRYDKTKEKGYLLIRYFDTFLLADFGDFLDKMVDFDKFVNTTNSGIHWKFSIMSNYGGPYTVRNQVDKREYVMKEIEVSELKKIFW